ncbi:MAG: TetR/AcrR family transcriptional regulator [Lachnospiraceae bacterium]|nr:TetR/AcrR family transcriptional regulator [Lachnospiraceae bacterium]
MRQKLDRRVEMTKRLLKKSLIELLKTENIQKISIRTLCENADVNRSTFYKHYNSQYALLKDIEDDLFADIEDILSTHTSSDNDSDKDVQLTKVLTHMKDNLDLCQILMLYNIDPEFENKLMSIPSVIKRSKLDSSSAFSFSSYSYTQLFILDGAYCMIKRWIINNCPESPAEIASLIRKISKKLYNE